jgi:uncharacterized protein (TIGR02001 family)
MKLLSLATLITLALCASQSVRAQDEAAVEAEAVEAEEVDKFWSANIAFVSDYRFRGISQTQSDPALQASVTFQLPGSFYAGVWGSTVDFPDLVDENGRPLPVGASWEGDLTLGWATEIIDGVGLDIALTRYLYPGTDVQIAYSELIGKVSAAGFTGVLGYSNDVFNTDETGIYYGLEYAHDINADMGLSAKATLGYYDLDDAPGYGGGITDYSIGIKKVMSDSLGVSLTYVDTNGALESSYGELNDNQVVFSMDFSF